MTSSVQLLHEFKFKNYLMSPGVIRVQVQITSSVQGSLEFKKKRRESEKKINRRWGWPFHLWLRLLLRLNHYRRHYQHHRHHLRQPPPGCPGCDRWDGHGIAKIIFRVNFRIKLFHIQRRTPGVQHPTYESRDFVHFKSKKRECKISESTLIIN